MDDASEDSSDTEDASIHYTGIQQVEGQVERQAKGQLKMQPEVQLEIQPDVQPEVQDVGVRPVEERHLKVLTPLQFTRRGLRSQITLGEEII